MSSLDEPLQAALARVHERISAAARAAGRDAGEIALLAVSKAFPAEAVVAAARAGQRRFGESYVQEAVGKIAQVRAIAPDLELEWHFVGPVQSNKTRAIAERFAWVHSVDRLKIAQRLSEQRPAHLPTLAVLIQVNVGGEATKRGVAPTEAPGLAHAVARLPRLRLRGLMAIPEPERDAARQRIPFTQLRELLERLQREGLAVDTLSMGMSADLEAAIAEGATIVRVGTAIFGKRT